MMTLGGADTSPEAGDSPLENPELSSLSDGPLSKQPKPRTAARRRRASDESKPFIKELFHKEPCPYSHSIFQLAALIFHALKHSYRNDSGYVGRGRKDERGEEKKVDIPNVDFSSENEKRLTFQLVFQTLKCKSSYGQD
ncbi:hypothetical protein LSH36_474g02022 [Paralvinella palmiformis]|uniref:Uncharacterized protein n=1 Tax=Paralvinella palmiformis TaxID=53620 RepID=A0AAD9J9W0_9ANNE|nr:hypothetical protein LSH36_474g02022 [Paralvinella palmiformis]